MAVGPQKGLRISADLKLHPNPAEEAADMATAETCRWDSVFPDLPGVDHF